MTCHSRARAVQMLRNKWSSLGGPPIKIVIQTWAGVVRGYASIECTRYARAGYPLDVCPDYCLLRFVLESLG